MNEEDSKRMELVQDFAKFLTSRADGSASVWTTYWFLRALICDQKPAVSKRMSVIRDMMNDDPSLWNRIVPYLDSKCEAVGGTGNSLIQLGKEQVSW